MSDFNEKVKNSLRVCDVLKSIESTSKRTEKTNYLKNIDDQDVINLFKMCIRYAYSTDMTFNVDNFTVDIDENLYNEEAQKTIYDLFPVLDRIVSRELTGDEAKNTLTSTIENMTTPDEKYLALKVINKDLRCGLGATSFNSVWKNLVYIHPYMRCASFNEKNLSKLKYPCIVQTKLDGMYADMYTKNNKFISRNGLPYSSLNSQVNSVPDSVKQKLVELFETDELVLQGELLYIGDNGEILPREESNGMILSDECDISRVMFVVWDILPESDHVQAKCDIEYVKRLEMLKEYLRHFSGEDLCAFQPVLVQTFSADTKEQAMAVFMNHLSNGHEGVIFKNKHGKWKNGESKDQIKGKNVFECTLKLVGYKPGEGKYENMVGSLQCKSSDGLVDVFVSGFSDSVRKEFTENIESLIENDTLIQIKANSIVTTDHETGLKSLFLPRFSAIRMDKYEADSLERIQEQEKAYILTTMGINL